MNTKTKNKKSWWLLSGALFIILSSIGWIFLGKAPSEIPPKEKEVAEIPTSKKVPKVPYLNRIEEARKLMNHGYYSEATMELSEAIKLKPDFIEPYLFLGEIYLQNNSNEKLENLIEKLNTSFPGNPQIGILQARKWINEKKFTAIMELLNGAENIPLDLLFYKAVLYTLQNNHDASKEILRELEQQPVTKSDFMVGADENKEIDVSKVLRPQFAKKVQDFRVVYEEFEELKEGKNAHLFAEFSKALAENNEAVLAREFADTAIKEDIEYIDAWILRGYSQYLSKDYVSAIKDFRHAYELDPIRPEVQYFLALALTEEGFLDEASLFFEKALEYDFEFSEEVRWKLIDILAQQKKYDQVLKLYKQLLDYESDPKKFASAVHTAIDVAKKPKMALEFTEIMIENNPDDPFAMNIHGWALIANQKFLEAEDILNKVLEKDPQNPRTYLNLGLLHEEMKDFDKAAVMYQKSYEIGKDLPGFAALVNLAADKYNEILKGDNRPKTPSRAKREESSP